MTKVVVAMNQLDGFAQFNIQSEDNTPLSAQQLLDAVTDYLLYKKGLEIKKQCVCDS